MSHVYVYILVTSHSSTSVARLKGLFSHGKYTVTVVQIETSKKLNEHQAERGAILWALTDCHSKDTSAACLLIRDTSVTTISSSGVCDTIETILTSGDFDLCYLCKWMDRCDLYTDAIELGTLHKNPIGSTLVTTYSPQGLQSILLKPSGVKCLLSRTPMRNAEIFVPEVGPLCNQLTRCVSEGKLKAVSVVPNLFEFDVLKARCNQDFLKLTGCLPPPYQEIEKSNTLRFASYFVFFLLIMLIVIGIYMLVYWRR